MCIVCFHFVYGCHENFSLTESWACFIAHCKHDAFDYIKKNNNSNMSNNNNKKKTTSTKEITKFETLAKSVKGISIYVDC